MEHRLAVRVELQFERIFPGKWLAGFLAVTRLDRNFVRHHDSSCFKFAAFGGMIVAKFRCSETSETANTPEFFPVVLGLGAE
jgi:hypothetical protein